MITERAAALLLSGALASLGACEVDPRGPFDIRPIDVDIDDCVHLVHPDLEGLLPAQLALGELHSFVSDGPGSAGGWMVLSAINPEEGGVAYELAVARIPADSDELFSLDFLGVPAYSGASAQLRAGSTPGEAWLMIEAAGEVELIGLRKDLGMWVNNTMLGNFPTRPASGCGQGWQRRLVLIEDAPYVLALPSCSSDPKLEAEILALNPQTLDFAMAWTLSFDPCAGSPDPQACVGALSYSIPSVGAGGASAIASAARVGLSLWQRRLYSDPESGLPDVSVYDVSFLDLRMLPAGPQARLISFREVWDNPVSLGPPVTTADPYSFQIYVHSLANNGGALMRLDTIADLYTQTKLALPLEGRGQLVQLPNESAVLGPSPDDIHRLVGVPLVNIESWPVWNEIELHTSEAEVVGVESAGVGYVLVRGGAAPTQLLELTCL